MYRGHIAFSRSIWYSDCVQIYQFVGAVWSFNSELISTLFIFPNFEQIPFFFQFYLLRIKEINHTERASTKNKSSQQQFNVRFLFLFTVFRFCFLFSHFSLLFLVFRLLLPPLFRRILRPITRFGTSQKKVVILCNGFGAFLLFTFKWLALCNDRHQTVYSAPLPTPETLERCWTIPYTALD